jgi:hypothetical protein
VTSYRRAIVNRIPRRCSIASADRPWAVGELPCSPLLVSCRVLSWCCAAWRGVAWRGVAWRGVAWRGVAWRGVACRVV